MKISAKEIREGELLPSWYYGRSYKDFCRDIDIFYVIPFNYIIRWGKNIRHLWNKLRSRRGWIDKQIMAAKADFAEEFYALEDERVKQKLQIISDKSFEDAKNEVNKETIEY